MKSETANTVPDSTMTTPITELRRYIFDVTTCSGRIETYDSIMLAGEVTLPKIESVRERVESLFPLAKNVSYMGTRPASPERHEMNRLRGWNH